MGIYLFRTDYLGAYNDIHRVRETPVAGYLYLSKIYRSALRQPTVHSFRFFSTAANCSTIIISFKPFFNGMVDTLCFAETLIVTAQSFRYISKLLRSRHDAQHFIFGSTRI